jgi:hypothetical protein
MYQLMLSQYVLQRERRHTRTRINLCKYSYLTRRCVTTTEVDLGRDAESNYGAGGNLTCNTSYEYHRQHEEAL